MRTRVEESEKMRAVCEREREGNRARERACSSHRGLCVCERFLLESSSTVERALDMGRREEKIAQANP